MMAQLETYFNNKTDFVVKKIESSVNNSLIKGIVENELSRHIINYRPNGFHNYYFQILNNEEYFLSADTFFRQFKSQYSLQGIDTDFLVNLEAEKSNMLSLVKQDNLSTLYFDYFASARVKSKNDFVFRNLGSFFAKFVHTFRPSDYCALDNPIKNYFGLKSESFFIAFLIVSKAYKIWSDKAFQTVKNLHEEFKAFDTENFFHHEKITDLKILDLVFWTKANSK